MQFLHRKISIYCMFLSRFIDKLWNMDLSRIPICERFLN